jgi:hypothetical protein
MDDSGDICASIELAIVDVFTQLIFGVDQQWGEQELSIVQALRKADHTVYTDSHGELGIYLRALGVQEMISLVSRVKTQLHEGVNFPQCVVTPEGYSRPNR